MLQLNGLTVHSIYCNIGTAFFNILLQQSLEICSKISNESSFEKLASLSSLT